MEQAGKIMNNCYPDQPYAGRKCALNNPFNLDDDSACRAWRASVL